MLSFNLGVSHSGFLLAVGFFSRCPSVVALAALKFTVMSFWI